jgi:hypothetical protein
VPRYARQVASRPPSLADLHRDPGEVARRLPEWRRGDVAEAVAETLAISARDTFGKAYTAWIWTGTTPDGAPAWILPVASSSTEAFAPRDPMGVLTRSLRAAVECGARASGIRLIDWEGYTALTLPGGEPDLAPVALAERHPAPARVSLATLPDSVPVDGPQLELAPISGRSGGGLVALARATRVHPATIALALLEDGWGLDEAAFPDDLADLLRHRGYEGPPEGRRTVSFAIEDDRCPRRRHVRRALRRLMHKGKIGQQYHTEFNHLARGAPPESRADALALGEALIRAGLLGEKPSVGQRHVYLRREALPAIHALIDRGETDDAGLRGEWTAPAPGERA